MPVTAKPAKIPLVSRDFVQNYAREVFGDPRKTISGLTTHNPFSMGCVQKISSSWEMRKMSQVFSMSWDESIRVSSE